MKVKEESEKAGLKLNIQETKIMASARGKILKEMGIPDHLSCHMRNPYAGQESTVRTVRGTMDWFQIGKGVHQGCILSPCLLNFYAEYIS